jgi:hypothetical protein
MVNPGRPRQARESLAHLPGQRDMSITKRYVHPHEFSTRAAMEKACVALSGHRSRHSPIASELIQGTNAPVSN